MSQHPSHLMSLLNSPFKSVFFCCSINPYVAIAVCFRDFTDINSICPVNQPIASNLISLVRKPRHREDKQLGMDHTKLSDRFGIEPRGSRVLALNHYALFIFRVWKLNSERERSYPRSSTGSRTEPRLEFKPLSI